MSNVLSETSILKQMEPEAYFCKDKILWAPTESLTLTGAQFYHNLAKINLFSFLQTTWRFLTIFSESKKTLTLTVVMFK